MNTNQEFLEYFGKKFAGEDFTINDLKDDGYIQGLLEKEELSLDLEENEYYLRQLNAMDKLTDELEEKKDELEKELNEQKEKFKDLTESEWTSTKYNKSIPLPVDYSVMDQREVHYQQRFEQRLGIMLSMVGSGSGNNSLSEKNMNKSVENFLKLKNKIEGVF
jgi:hypothetical protein